MFTFRYKGYFIHETFGTRTSKERVRVQSPVSYECFPVKSVFAGKLLITRLRKAAA